MYSLTIIKRIENIYPYPNKNYSKKQWDHKEEEFNDYEIALNKAIELYKNEFNITLYEIIKEGNNLIKKPITHLSWSKNE